MQVNFKKYKKIYWDIKLSDKEIENSWQQFSQKNFTRSPLPFPLAKYGAIFFSLLVIFLVGIVGLTQAATSGNLLYPVKILSDKVVGKISNKPEINTEKRAQEIIEVLKKQPEKLEEASKEYHQALKETEKEVEDNEDHKERVSSSLEKQEQKLEETIKENPSSEKELKEALKNTKALKEKLKKDSK